MGLPTSIEAIVVILIVFIPGYVFLQFTKRAVAHIPQSVDARYFFAVIAWGSIIHAAASSWTIPIIEWYRDGRMADHTTYLVWWGIIVLIVAPVLFGAIGAWIVTWGWMNHLLKFTKMDYIGRTPTAWEYAIRTGAVWVQIHLKDGSIVGGVFGDRSFADTTGEQDIFLEKLYILDQDGDFERPVPNSVGLWVPQSEIQLIVFSREIVEEDNDGTDEDLYFDKDA